MIGTLLIMAIQISNPMKIETTRAVLCHNESGRLVPAVGFVIADSCLRIFTLGKHKFPSKRIFCLCEEAARSMGVRGGPRPRRSTATPPPARSRIKRPTATSSSHTGALCYRGFCLSLTTVVTANKEIKPPTRSEKQPAPAIGFAKLGPEFRS